MKEDIGFLVKKMHEAFEKRINRELKKENLTITQTRVLWFMRSRKDKVITQRDIEKYLNVSHPTVVGIIKRLEINGFIVTTADDYDKRQKIVILTEKERYFFDRMDEMHSNFEKLITKDISEADLNITKKTLNKIIKNIQK